VYTTGTLIVVVVNADLQPVNTTRVNASEITNRVAALQTDKDQARAGKPGFFEEFEVTVSLLSDILLIFRSTPSSQPSKSIRPSTNFLSNLNMIQFVDRGG